MRGPSLVINANPNAAGAAAFGRLVEVGQALKGCGAGAVILGCAGLARHRAAFGVPVIDPALAAVARALGAVLAG